MTVKINDRAFEKTGLGGGSVKEETADLAARISLAISAKRIADYLQPIEITGKPIGTYIGAGGERYPINAGPYPPRPAKQTSPEISSLAAKYLAMSHIKLAGEIKERGFGQVMEDIKKLAASCLSQDETMG